MTSEKNAHEVDIEGDFADEFDSPSENHRMAAHHFSEAAKEHELGRCGPGRERNLTAERI